MAATPPALLVCGLAVLVSLSRTALYDVREIDIVHVETQILQKVSHE
jgi:hypothetical protein